MLLCVSYLNNGSICQCPECRKQTYSQAKKFGSGGAKAILEKTGGMCWYCGVELTDNSRINDTTLTKKQKATMFTIDHYEPMAKGGSRTKFKNLLPCCNKCNNLKGCGGQEWLRTQLMFLKNGWPKFNHAQFQFLEKHGIHLEDIERYVFFFERSNLPLPEEKNGE